MRSECPPLACLEDGIWYWARAGASGDSPAAEKLKVLSLMAAGPENVLVILDPRNHGAELQLSGGWSFRALFGFLCLLANLRCVSFAKFGVAVDNGFCVFKASDICSACFQKGHNTVVQRGKFPGLFSDMSSESFYGGS